MKRTALCLALAFLAAATSAVGDDPPPASFADFDRRAKAGEELSVVFFGGSLTWSANASDPNRTGFRPLVAEHLLAKYPRARFRFHDAGLGGTGSTLGVFRLDRDVLAHAPDLVFLDFACNDGGGPEALDCEVRAGGEPLATFRGSHGAGAGRLFIWRQALLSGWERGEAEERAFTFDPIPSPDGTGEFRIGAVCTATIRPATPEPAASGAPAFDLDDIDHGRQP